jgi:hypothetical protein
MPPPHESPGEARLADCGQCKVGAMSPCETPSHTGMGVQQVSGHDATLASPCRGAGPMSILAWRLTGPLPERTGERLFAREPNRQRNPLYRLTGTAQLFDGPARVARRPSAPAAMSPLLPVDDEGCVPRHSERLRVREQCVARSDGQSSAYVRGWPTGDRDGTAERLMAMRAAA